MFQRLLIIGCFFITCSCIFSQKIVAVQTAVPILKVDADDFVGVDNLGYYYYIKNNVFYKQKEAEIWQYQNIGLGEIAKVDLINPLKIVLFYENFNKVILLDNQLNEVNVVDFSLLADVIIAHNVGMCGQNNLWIFNSMNQQVGLFNYENRKYTVLNQAIKNLLLFSQTDFNSFVWIDDTFKAYKMDVFGKVLFLGAIPQFDVIQFVSDTQFLFLKNNKLYYQKEATLQPIELETIEKSIKKFSYKDKILTIFTGTEIITYNLILP